MILEIARFNANDRYSGTPARTEGRRARFLLRAHHKHVCTKIIKSLERAGGAAAPCPLPPCLGVPVDI